MTRAMLPAKKIMIAASEMMKDKDRQKGTKHRLETLAAMAQAAHEDADAKSMEIDLDDFELVRPHYPYVSNNLNDSEHNESEHNDKD